MDKSPAESRFPQKRKILIPLFIVLIVVIGYGIYKVYPYLRATPISNTEAAAIIADCKAPAAEIQSRSGADREAVEKLFESWKDKFKAVEDETPDMDECPIVPDDFSYDTAPFLKEFGELSAEMAGIVDDGFVWKQEFNYDSDVMNFYQVRQWVKWELASAFLNAKSDQTPEVIAKITRVQNVIAALYDAPALIHLMIGVALEDFMYRGVAAAIPYLDSEELHQLADSFQKQADIKETFKTSLRLEAAWFVNTLEYLKTDKRALDMLTNTKESGIPQPVASAMHKFYKAFMLDREVNYYMGLLQKTLDQIDSGAISEDPPWSEYEKNGYKSLTCLLAWPNYRSLFERVLRAKTRREKLVAVLNAEAALSPEARQVERTYSYDDKNTLLIKANMGCVKDIENEKTT